MKRLVLMLFVCALTVGAQGAPGRAATQQNVPGHPSADALSMRSQPRQKPWYKSGIFWGSTAIAVAAAVADGITTSRALERCPACFEENSILGKRPTRRRVFLIGLTSLAAERALIAFVWSRNEHAGQGMAFTATALRGAYHGVFALDNAQVKAEPRACPANGVGCR